MSEGKDDTGTPWLNIIIGGVIWVLSIFAGVLIGHNLGKRLERKKCEVEVAKCHRVIQKHEASIRRCEGNAKQLATSNKVIEEQSKLIASKQECIDRLTRVIDGCA